MTASLNCKYREILDQVQIVKHGSRKDFIARYIPALIQSGSVQFHEAAKYLKDETKVSSNTIRIQDFYREAEINYVGISTLLFSMLPSKKKLRVCIDRTEWDFGTFQVNILMVMVGCNDFYIPFCWQLLDNRSGNSNCQNRIDLLEKVLEIIPPKRIGLLIGDREFIGQKWLKYLKDENINFCVRVPKSHKIEPLGGEVLDAKNLSTDYPDGIHLNDCMVDGVWGNVFVKPLENKDILFVFGTCKAKFLGQLYEKRWAIEACFQNLKTRGFNLEDSHMKDIGKISKLVAMVSIAYAFCLSLGIYKDRKIKKIAKKKHGYKTNSFFRAGKNMLNDVLRSKNNIEKVLLPIFCIFARLIIQRLKIKKILNL